jgi:hypothetical protein
MVTTTASIATTTATNTDVSEAKKLAAASENNMSL